MSSDLRILVLGRNNDITAVGNALLGREVFDEYKTVSQRHSVTLGDKMVLHVTCATGKQVYKKDNEWYLCDELVTDINTTVYHAVVFTMKIYPVLALMYPTAAECMLRDTCWKDFLRKKGVIVVREAKTFNEARSTGEITGSFLDWMKGKGRVVRSILQEVQERCALFDTSGTLDVLAKQRNDLVYMVDTRILGGGYYTDIKFQESQLRSVELEKQLTESIKDRKKLEKRTDKVEKSLETQLGGLKKQLGENLQAEKIERKGDIETIRQQIETHNKQLDEYLQTEKTERKGNIETIRQHIETNSDKAENRCEEIEKQISDHMKVVLEEIATLRKDLKDQQKNSIWEKMKSVKLPVSSLTSPWKMSLLLVVVGIVLLFLLPILTPFLFSVPPTDRKEITALDKSQDLRRYMDAKFKETATRFQLMERQLIDMKILSHIKKENTKDKDETDPQDKNKYNLSMMEVFSELREQIVNETSEKLESMSKTIPQSSNVWNMIQSLPMSLLLILVCTFFMSQIIPMRLRFPRTEMIGTLLMSIFIVQVLIVIIQLTVALSGYVW